MGLKQGDELEIVEAADHKVTVEKADRKKAALERMASRRWSLSQGPRFNRDEANER
jgi:antitoxin MazE